MLLEAGMLVVRGGCCEGFGGGRIFFAAFRQMEVANKRSDGIREDRVHSKRKKREYSSGEDE